MSATFRSMVLAAVLAVAAGRAGAEDAISPQRLGEWLGFVVMCGCLPYESSHQEAAFYAMLVEEEGERYADTAAGYMRRIVTGDWHSPDTVCSGYICNNDYTVYLGEILAMIDMETEPDEFLDAYERIGIDTDEPAADPEPHICTWKMHRSCSD